MCEQRLPIRLLRQFAGPIEQCIKASVRRDEIDGPFFPDSRNT